MPRLTLLVIAICSTAGGCFTPRWSTPMGATPQDDPRAAAPEHLARIVFEAEAASSGVTRDANANPDLAPVHVVDASGHLLGDIGWRSWFAVDVTPGEHLFFAWDDDYRVASPGVFALRANVRAGHNYYVRVAHERGIFRDEARGGTLLFVRAPAPLDALVPLSPRRTDPDSAKQWAESNRAEIVKRIARGQARVDGGQFSALNEGDGFVFRRGELE